MPLSLPNPTEPVQSPSGAPRPDELALSLARAIAAHQGVPFDPLTNDEQGRRLLQARRVLAERDPLVRTVALYRARAAAVTAFRELVIGRPLDAKHQVLADLIFRAGLIAYECSLEGVTPPPTTAEYQQIQKGATS